MKTFVNVKTGERLPEHGCENSFWDDRGKFKLFIRGIGWKPAKRANWREEVVEDLPEGFTNAQFREYAKKYGVACAQEFQPCCDMMKPTFARFHLDPDTPSEDTYAWFERTFGRSLRLYEDSVMFSLAGKFVFDVIKFEQFLAGKGYDPNSDNMSMSDFVTGTYGKEVTDRIHADLLRSPKLREPKPELAS